MACHERSRPLVAKPSLRPSSAGWCALKPNASELPITIDLFATAENAFVPRFFARHPEPEAEAADALAQPDWGRSLCPHCSRWHRETVFAFPPLPLLARTLAKARADGIRGVFVVPFTPSHPTWPVLAAASLTHIDGQLDRCVIVPNSEPYVRTSGSSAATQRLAVMAVDFTPRSARPVGGLTDPCPRAAYHRPRASRLSAQAASDRARIAAALLRLGLAGRSGQPNTNAGAGPLRPSSRGPARPSPYLNYLVLHPLSHVAPATYSAATPSGDL